MTAQVQQLIDTPVEEISASDAATELAPDTSEPAETLTARPAGVPEKFWDREAGAIRTDALLKSYVELERKLGSRLVVTPSRLSVQRRISSSMLLRWRRSALVFKIVDQRTRHSFCRTDGAPVPAGHKAIWTPPSTGFLARFELG